MAASTRTSRVLPAAVTAVLLAAIGVSFGAGGASQPPARVRPGEAPADMRKTFVYNRSCEIQIQEERSIDQTLYNYYPSVSWSWDHKVSTIKFRVVTKGDKTATVVWQVSAAPFDNSRKDWSKPVGLLATGKIDRTAEYTWAPIDFALFAPRPPVAQPKAETPARGSGAGVGASRDRDLRARAARGAARVAPPQRALQAPPPAPPVPAGVTLTPAANGTRNLQLTGPTSFFVRALALDAKGNVIGYPSKTIEVTWGPQKEGSVHWVAPPQPPPAVHPTLHVTEYIAIRHATNRYSMLCVQSTLGFTAGKVYDFTPRPDSGFEKFVDSWGGLFGFMAQCYTWVAQTYNGIRNTALDAVASAVGEINPELGKAARAAAEAALNVGMTAVGIPPTLPTTDDLVGMGKDYIAATLADQVPGLPPEAAKAAVDKMATSMKNSYRSGGGNPAVLFVPDPDKNAEHPAVLWLEVANTGAEPTTPMDLKVSFGEFTPDVHTVGHALGGAYGEIEYKDGFRPMQLYKSRSMPLPSMAPGTRLRIPFVCDPTYEEMRDGYNPVQFACWQDGYCNHKIAVAVETTLANPTAGGPPNTKTQQTLSLTADKDWKPSISGAERRVVLPRQ